MNIKTSKVVVFTILVWTLIASSHSNSASVRYGAELNPISLTGIYISGGFNAFFPDQALEVAVPFVYRGDDWSACNYDYGHDVTVDFAVRKYLYYSEQKTMPYVGMFLRHRQLEAVVDESCNYGWWNDSPLTFETKYKAARNAIALNIGFRRITKNNFYIGANVSYGRYFDNGIEGATSPFSGRGLFDVELLKVGYIFK